MYRIKKIAPFVLLIFISIILIITNYTPGTFLSGWDTLHPEFNFPEYFKRILFGVWQSHQGLGAISSQAHPSEFSRMLIYYPLSFIFPLSFLRYSYFFITLIAGTLGVYFFVKKTILKDETFSNKIASFGGALFYLLNLGTLQHYIVPFEMFATHFATLPWLFLFLVQYLREKTKIILLLFALFTFFSTSIAHTSTLWFAYFFALSLFLFIFNVLTRKKQILLNSLTIMLVTLLINSFWLLPNLYFILNYGKSVADSKIHSLFTPEAFVQNKRFGTIQDILIFRNFLFDWSQYVGDGKFGPLLNDWINHLNKPYVTIIGYTFSLVALVGLIYSVSKKNVLALSLLGILISCIFFLFTTNPPFGFLFAFLQNTLPFFKEALRFPFTKFSILLMFVMSIYFAWGLSLFARRFSLYLFIILVGSFIYYAQPAFQGKLIDPAMKIKIPSEYFSLFKWFKNQPQGRIATLPIHSFWGWTYYKWGYQGAGFLWFGLKGPLLDREFDRWNPNNEQYYREMSHAIYSQDAEKLKNVLTKYDIRYIFLDKSIISPEQRGNSRILFLQETESLLTNASDIQKVFEKNNLSVYQTGVRHETVRILENPVSIGSKARAFYDDFAYFKYKDYITYPDINKNTVFYPFRDIMDNQNRLTSNIIRESYPDKTILQDVFAGQTINECAASVKENSISEKKIMEENSEKFVRYSSFSGSFCDHYSFPNLPRNQGYLISIISRNIKGLPLRLCFTNYMSRRCDLYTQTAQSSAFKEDIFILPPIDESVGFDINFNNFAITKSPSVNDLKSIKITPFPYSDLSQIEQYNPAGYSKDINVIIYSQSFDKGWKAYQIQNSKFKIQNWITNIFPSIFGKELKEHVLVNNWANGWVLDNNLAIQQSNNSRIVIVFLPQYLEYIGLIILTCAFVYLLLPARKTQAHM